MNQERKRILAMLASGKITADEAEELFDALGGQASALHPEEPRNAAAAVKFIYVKVVSVDDNVDVKIPLSLVRAGMRLTSLIPPQAMEHINTHLKDKGMQFDFNNIRQEDIEELIKSLGEMEVNVNSKNGDNVRVYCA
jgi:DUF4097 and DUF4098 domain-containing protein YvlB